MDKARCKTRNDSDARLLQEKAATPSEAILDCMVHGDKSDRRTIHVSTKSESRSGDLHEGDGLNPRRMVAGAIRTICLFLSIAVLMPTAHANRKPPGLTTARQVRTLSAEEAKLAHPVKFRGVVTALSGWKNSFFFADERQEFPSIGTTWSRSCIPAMRSKCGELVHPVCLRRWLNRNGCGSWGAQNCRQRR